MTQFDDELLKTACASIVRLASFVELAATLKLDEGAEGRRQQAEVAVSALASFVFQQATRRGISRESLKGVERVMDLFKPDQSDR